MFDHIFGSCTAVVPLTAKPVSFLMGAGFRPSPVLISGDIGGCLLFLKVLLFSCRISTAASLKMWFPPSLANFLLAYSCVHCCASHARTKPSCAMLYGLRSLTLTRSRKDLASTLVRMNRILRRLRSLARLHIIIDRACSTFLTSTSTDPQLTLN